MLEWQFRRGPNHVHQFRAIKERLTTPLKEALT